MRRAVSVLAIIAIYLAASNSATPSEKITTHNPENVSVSQKAPEKITLTAAEQTLADMTLEQKIGQMMFVGYDGEGSAQQLQSLVANSDIGGVMLIGPNVDTTEDAKILVTALQQSAGTKLFISIDQEGGVVNRISDKEYELRSQTEINSRKLAREVATKRAKELASLGVNTNFSPVLEDITNPDSFLYERVFRGTRQDISDYGSAYISSYEQHGILATAKHFPGHDNASADSHIRLPVIKTDTQGFTDHISIFRNVLSESNPSFVMISHTLFPNQDNTHPASLSRVIIQDYLRGQIGYRGLIITDDLSMRAITQNYGKVDAAVLAVNAGNDILLYVEDEASIVEIKAGIIAAVKAGDIRIDYINNAVLRILETKNRI